MNKIKISFVLCMSILLVSQNYAQTQFYKLPRVRVDKTHHTENEVKNTPSISLRKDKKTVSSVQFSVAPKDSLIHEIKEAVVLQEVDRSDPDKLLVKPINSKRKNTVDGNKQIPNQKVIMMSFQTKQLKRKWMGNDIQATKRTNIIFMLVIFPSLLLIFSAIALIFFFIALANPLSLFTIVSYILFGLTGVAVVVYTLVLGIMYLST